MSAQRPRRLPFTYCWPAALVQTVELLRDIRFEAAPLKIQGTNLNRPCAAAGTSGAGQGVSTDETKVSADEIAVRSMPQSPQQWQRLVASQQQLFEEKLDVMRQRIEKLEGVANTPSQSQPAPPPKRKPKKTMKKQQKKPAATADLEMVDAFLQEEVFADEADA